MRQIESSNRYCMCCRNCFGINEALQKLATSLSRTRYLAATISFQPSRDLAALFFCVWARRGENLSTSDLCQNGRGRLAYFERSSAWPCTGQHTITVW
jgi:hypothetical protein